MPITTKKAGLEEEEKYFCKILGVVKVKFSLLNQEPHHEDNVVMCGLLTYRPFTTSYHFTAALGP
jgi:hypothetical protein